MYAVTLTRYGGPETLVCGEVPHPEPGRGEVLVHHRAIGVNYYDIYERTGLYPPPHLPSILGQEAAGTIEKLGPEVDAFREGDRVVYAAHTGSYAEYAVVPVTKVVPIPASLDDPTAAAVLQQGITAHYLSQSVYAIRAGETVLIHAAAGGVGLLLVQLARQRGARVIGTVSTSSKARVAASVGADEVILYTQVDFAAEVRRLTAGEGVAVIFDGVGKETFEKGLSCLRPQGTIVLYGQSSGTVTGFDPSLLGTAGSVYLTRPFLSDFITPGERYLTRAGDVLAWAARGTLRVHIAGCYPLAETARAHSDLESRRTIGKLLLLPPSS
jgi:NADPH:quinone reductase